MPEYRSAVRRRGLSRCLTKPLRAFRSPCYNNITEHRHMKSSKQPGPQPFSPSDSSWWVVVLLFALLYAECLLQLGLRSFIPRHPEIDHSVLSSNYWVEASLSAGKLAVRFVLLAITALVAVGAGFGLKRWSQLKWQGRFFYTAIPIFAASEIGLDAMRYDLTTFLSPMEAVSLYAALFLISLWCLYTAKAMPRYLYPEHGP